LKWFDQLGDSSSSELPFSADEFHAKDIGEAVLNVLTSKFVLSE
jgi:hypothetical protein